MAKRLFLVYALVELAVMVVLVATIGFGWTVLLLLAAFVVGLALAGSQARRQLRKLSGGLTAASAQGAVTDSLLVALGTVLVVVPGARQFGARRRVAAAPDPCRRAARADRDGRQTRATRHRISNGVPVPVDRGIPRRAWGRH